MLGEIYELYIDLNTRFKFDAFEGYKVTLVVKDDSIIMHYMINLNIQHRHKTFGI